MTAGRTLGVCLAAFLALAACSPAQTPASDADATVRANLSWYLQPAFKAAFGADAPAPREIVRNGGRTTMLYSPNLLADLGNGRAALIATGLPAGGCQDCGGAVAVAYLRRSGDRFTLLNRWDDVGGLGPTGDPPAVGLAPDLFASPALQIETTTRKDACETTRASLFELEPGGPTARALDIVLARTDLDAEPASDAVLASGSIVAGERGRGFTVRYRGTPPQDVIYAPGNHGGMWKLRGDFTAPIC